jgi:hypothetical protein
VADELKGSKIAREGLAATPTPLGWGVGIMVASFCVEGPRFYCECWVST